MEDWQERVVVERDELNIKLIKLGAFLYDDVFLTLSPIDRTLLKCQHMAMNVYCRILSERIALFKGVHQP